MRAFVFDGVAAVKDVPRPKPSPREALVKVQMAGICKTDVEITRGYMSFCGVLGHEFVGSVEQSPDPALIGARVVAEINVGCGQCTYCRSGLERHCLGRSVIGILGRDGAMAEYLAIPVSNLVPVPDTLPDEKAVFTEPLAAALEIIEQVKIEPSHRVLVIGDGKLGLLVSMVLRLTGCDLTLVGKHRGKMDILTDKGVSLRLLDSFSMSEDKFDVIVEASGNPSGWGLAVSGVKPRGTIILKSTYHGDLNFNPAPLVINEITVVGSRCGRFGPAIRVMERGLIDPTPLISGVFPFERVEEAFAKAQDRDALKILLKMPS
jgi:threonine dehydrogenase-like Zn-dependent dehydrogenase